MTRSFCRVRKDLIERKNKKTRRKGGSESKRAHLKIDIHTYAEESCGEEEQEEEEGVVFHSKNV